VRFYHRHRRLSAYRRTHRLFCSYRSYGKELSFDEIKFFVNGFTDGSVPDYQASALLMAICLKGMSDSEISNLTLCMAQSGDMNDMSKIDGRP